MGPQAGRWRANVAAAGPCRRANVLALTAIIAWCVCGHTLWAAGPAAPMSRRVEATLALSQARQRVALAQVRVEEARKQLDDLLSRHFDGQNQLELPPSGDQGDAKVVLKIQPDPQLASLETQLADLRAQRDHLLGSLTEAHPEVVDVDVRMAAVEQRIATLKKAAGDGSAADKEAADQSGSTPHRRLAEAVTRQREQSARDAAEYERLFARWQSAEHELEAARATEIAAAEQLLLLATTAERALRQADRPPPQDSPAAPRRNVATVPAEESSEASRSVATGLAAQRPVRRSTVEQPAASIPASQIWVLAALVAALTVAALAAVRLARSSSDPNFASAQEVAAALAIPVVGIVPAYASTGAARTAGGPRRMRILSGQILLAVLVFAAIAYAIASAGELWAMCTNPIGTFRWLTGT